MATVLLTRQDALFLHLPKTAGFSVSTALARLEGAESYPVRGLRRLRGAAQVASRRLGRDVFERTFSFAVVRDPWDWAVSGWKHVTENTKAYPDGGPGFEAFLTGGWREGLSHNPNPMKFKDAELFVRYHCFATQWDHLSDARGRLVPLAYTARFERLADELRVVEDRLGVRLDLPHRNRSERAPYEAYYTPALRERVARANAPLIRRFGYEFGGR